MNNDDLASLPSLTDSHRRALAELGVTTCFALVLADRDEIHKATRRSRPRPTLADIAVWQDEARARLHALAPARGETASEAPSARAWERAASFAVVFEQRDGERRLAVEQTELERLQPEEVWPGWDCRGICAWMLQQLAAPVTPGSARAANIPSPSPPEQRAEPGAVAAVPAIAIQVRLIEQTRTREILDTAGAVQTPLSFGGDARLAVRVSGLSADHELHVVTRIRRPDAPGWNLTDPIVIHGAGSVEFPLAPLAVGQHMAGVLAWAPDGSATPSVRRLPPLDRLADP